MHLGQAKDFKQGAVVRYVNAQRNEQFGHVDGFALNSVNEVIIVVKLPLFVGIPDDPPIPPRYEYRSIHPGFLEIM